MTALRRFTVRGSVSPRRAKLVLEIARKGSDARQHPVARLPVTVRAGQFSALVRLRRPALHRLRIAFPGDRRNVAARSADVYLRERVRADAQTQRAVHALVTVPHRPETAGWKRAAFRFRSFEEDART